MCIRKAIGKTDASKLFKGVVDAPNDLIEASTDLVLVIHANGLWQMVCDDNAVITIELADRKLKAFIDYI